MTCHSAIGCSTSTSLRETPESQVDVGFERDIRIIMVWHFYISDHVSIFPGNTTPYCTAEHPTQFNDSQLHNPLCTSRIYNQNLGSIKNKRCNKVFDKLFYIEVTSCHIFFNQGTNPTDWIFIHCDHDRVSLSHLLKTRFQRNDVLRLVHTFER